MELKVPDLLRYELRHWSERLGNAIRWRDLRQWINDHPTWAIGIACLSLVLLVFAFIRVLTPSAPTAIPQGGSAWFYDAGTGRLFTDASKRIGPIAAPSGPLSDGSPAGFRAHVYSYAFDPNESELFVGFLERPNPSVKAKKLVTDMKDLDAWARGRQVKRLDDEQWIDADSRQGQALLQSLLSPNSEGKTPLYQLPKP